MRYSVSKYNRRGIGRHVIVLIGQYNGVWFSCARGELIDLDRFIALWREFYPKLTDEDKAVLPLVPIYFYAPTF